MRGGARSAPAPLPRLSWAALGALALVALQALSGVAEATTGNSTAVDSSGRVVVAGTTNNTFAVARYEGNGQLDPSFGTRGRVTTAFGPGCTASGSAVAIDSSNRIVVAGSSRCIGGKSRIALARYDADGSLDRTFGNRGRVTTGSTSRRGLGGQGIAIDSAGRILVAGTTSYAFAVARYSPNGTLDPTFGSDGVVTTHFNTSGSAEAVAAGPSGTITVAGPVCFCTHDEALEGAALVRYTAAGALDSTFGSGGVVTRFSLPGGSFDDLAIDPSGRVVVAGGSDGGFFLARYTSSGAPDSTFGSGGEVTTKVGSGTNEAANALALDPSGRIVAAGFTYACGRFTCGDDFALARVNPDGSLDPGFGTGGAVTTDFGPGAVDRARDVALAPAGDIVAVGTSGDAFGLARYTPGGALDSTFGAGGMVTTTFKPNTWISDVRIKSKKRTASFRFAAGSPNSGFQCALRSKEHPKARYEGCHARFGERTYEHLERGRYTFAVRAIFRGGPDPTPAKWRFRIR